MSVEGEQEVELSMSSTRLRIQTELGSIASARHVATRQSFIISPRPTDLFRRAYTVPTVEPAELKFDVVRHNRNRNRNSRETPATCR